MSSTSATGVDRGGDVAARRARGIALIVGAVVLLALVETDVVPRYWFPAITGLTYLAAAAVGRSRGTLWAPGATLTIAGLSLALWFRDGRPGDSFELLALTLLAVGAGGVVAALLNSVAGFAVSAMSVALSVLVLGAFLLLEQQGVAPFAGNTWPFAVLLAAWGAYELRPART